MESNVNRHSLPTRIALALLLLASTLLSQEQKPSKPNVTPPVTPKGTDQDLRDLPHSQPWKPGDPVREVPDLKQSDPAGAVVSEAVIPRFFNGRLDRLPIA